MKLSLKNVKIANHLSEETLAFTATLYVDGKETASVSNRGTGGSNNYYHIDPEAKERVDRAEDYAREKTGDDVEALDILIATMLDEDEMWKGHRRREKIRVRVVGDGNLMEWNPKGKVRPEHLEGIKGAPWWKEDYKMLNGLGKDEFLEVMKEVA